MGVKVTLLEYDHIEGMILRSELSRRRIRSIKKLIRVNRSEYVRVLRVDTEKGYIDLSKRQVDGKDIDKCKDRYNKAKAVHSVLQYVAHKRSVRLEALYQTIGWPLYRKYTHAYDAFKMAIGDTTTEDVFEGIEIEPEVRADILAYVVRKFAAQAVKIRADIDVTCYTYEGIDAIKEALIQGEAAGTAETPIKIRLIAPPTFVMTLMTMDQPAGIELLNQSIEVIRTILTAKGGTLGVKMAPKAVSLREEQDLNEMLERLNLDGDEEDEEGDEEDGEEGDDLR